MDRSSFDFKDLPFSSFSALFYVYLCAFTARFWGLTQEPLFFLLLLFFSWIKQLLCSFLENKLFIIMKEINECLHLYSLCSAKIKKVALPVQSSINIYETKTTGRQNIIFPAFSYSDLSADFKSSGSSDKFSLWEIYLITFFCETLWRDYLTAVMNYILPRD